MYTSVCIAQFFSKFQQQFEAYNFVGALYEPEMDFSKLKPYILNNENTQGKDNAWCGIIFNRQTVQPGLIYKSTLMQEEWTDPDTNQVMLFHCAPSSCEVNFNIVSNEIEHLEALENELRWYYNGRYEYTIQLNKLPDFKLDIGDITYGDFTKYNSKEFGQLCSLGMAVSLNYPILLRGSNVNVIKRINYLIGQNIPKNVFMEYTISSN